MSIRSNHMALLLAALLVLSRGAIGQQRKQPPRENLRTTATIKGMARGVLQIVTEDGGQWLVRMPEQERLTFTASAEPGWLQRGMLVRFTGTFDSKGKPQSVISELEVFNLREGFKLGIFPDEDRGISSSGLFSSEDGEKNKKKKKKGKKKTAPRNKASRYFISGQLFGLKGNKIAVKAGGTVVQAELAEKVRVSVQLNNVRYVREGDKVQVDAWYPAGQKAAGRAIATKLAITAAKPLAAPAKRQRRKKSRSSQRVDKNTEKKDTEKKDTEKKDTEKKDTEKKDT